MPFKDDLKNQNPAMYTYAEETAWPGDAAGVLADRMYYDLFRRFLGTEHSEDSLDFLTKAATYKSSPGAAVGQEVYDEYISLNGAHPQNLTGGTKGALDAIWGPDSPDDAPFDGATFDGAVRETISTLNDPYRRLSTIVTEIQDEKTASIDWDNVQGR